MSNAVEHSFLSLPLWPVSQNELIDWLLPPEGGHGRLPVACAYLNAHTVNIALRGAGAQAALWRNMDLVYADGMSVVRGARRARIDVPGRVSAADFFLRFCWTAASRGRNLALVGGAPGIASSCAENLRQIVPGLRVSLCHQGFAAPGSEDERAMLRKIRESEPDVVLLGMGSPRQEQLALQLRDREGIPATWCVGALFEYFAPGARARAPRWMCEAGLEWLFRLAMEPRRLATRYILGNAEFLLRSRGHL